jgi:hypothetical protein
MAYECFLFRAELVDIMIDTYFGFLRRTVNILSQELQHLDHTGNFDLPNTKQNFLFHRSEFRCCRVCEKLSLGYRVRLLRQRRVGR